MASIAENPQKARLHHYLCCSCGVQFMSRYYKPHCPLCERGVPIPRSIPKKATEVEPATDYGFEIMSVNLGPYDHVAADECPVPTREVPSSLRCDKPARESRREPKPEPHKTYTPNTSYFDYDEVRDGEVEPCAYCGMPAESVDHVIPRSLRYMLQDVGGWRSRWGRITDTLPCCTECNTIAGSMVFNTVREKRMYIHERIEKKYASVLRTPAWDDDELEEVGDLLGRWIHASDELARQTRNRLRWRGSIVRENFGKYEPAVDEADLDEE